jgi:steroid delta-isomerase-like uncharacterized protein
MPTLTDLPTAFFLGQDALQGPLVPDLVSPDYRAEIVGFPQMDAEGHGQFGRAFYAAFPDMRHTIDEVVAADPHVAVRFTLRGTQSGDFMGIPATGRRVEIVASAFLTVDDGRVTRLRAQFDQLGLLKQLGALSA